MRVSDHVFLQLQKVLFVKKYPLKMGLKQNKQIERLQREFAGSRWLLYSTPFLHASMTNWYPHHHDVRFSRAFILFRVGFVLNCRYWGLLQKLLSQSITGGVKASCPSWATSGRKQMMTACGINCYTLLQTEIDYRFRLFQVDDSAIFYMI